MTAKPKRPTPPWPGANRNWTAGSIDLPLRYDPPTKPRHVVDHEFGKHALTFWKVLERLR